MSDQPLFADTDPQVETFLVQRLRDLPPHRKWRMVQELNASMRHLLWLGLKARLAHADDVTLQRHLARQLLGEEIGEKVARLRETQRSASMSIPEPLDVTLRVTQVLDDLNVPYFITGSLASALYGIARTTLDADIVADLTEEHVRPLVEALSGEFYIAEEAVRDAIRHRRSFNVIHLETMFKVDIFVSQKEGFDRSRLQRRVALAITGEEGPNAYFASLEDTILAKLAWYRKGGEISDRQWQDVVGMVRVSGERLDMEYLRVWAKRLGVDALLQQALDAAGMKGSVTPVEDTPTGPEHTANG